MSTSPSTKPRPFTALTLALCASFASLGIACATLLDGRESPSFSLPPSSTDDEPWGTQPARVPGDTDRSPSPPAEEAAVSSPAVPAQRARVLVLEPRSAVMDAATLSTITGIIVVELTQNRGFDVIAAADVQRLAELEGQRQNAGCDSAACLAEIAGAIGARYVVFGDVGALGELLVLNLNLFDSETSKAVNRVTVQARSIETLAGMLPTRTKELSGPLARDPAMTTPTTTPKTPATQPTPRPTPMPMPMPKWQAPTATRTPAVQAPCASQLDCSAGWCRDRGDGRKVCMDQGAAGAYCSSGNDCASAFFCKQWGDGSRRCMGNRAPAGAPCSSGIDCAGSCKDRGDGLRVCMGG